MTISIRFVYNIVMSPSDDYISLYLGSCILVANIMVMFQDSIIAIQV